MAITIRTRTGAQQIDPAPGENLLYAGLRAGLPLPYECATGTCGTCRARVKSGTLDDAWPQAPGRASLKPELGDVLLCQSTMPVTGAGPGQAGCEVLVPGKLPTRPWHRFRPAHGTATLHGIEHLTEDVIAFRLRLDRPIDYLAGQFLAIEFPGITGYRAYSMTNFAPRTQDLSFVIKRVAGGSVSDLLFASQSPSAAHCAPVRFFGPLGGAVFLPEERRHVLAIAGGSGVAGMMSILDQAARSCYFEDHDGRLFFGIRTREDAFFLKELNALALQCPRLEIVIALSDQPLAADIAPNFESGPLRFERGFVHQVAAAHLNDDLDRHVAFVAGPPPMVDRTLRALLVDGQLTADQIRYDKFA